MSIRKIICALLALVMLITACAATLADDLDLQAKLDAANQRIEELEAEVELYRPFYEAQILAEFGDGGIVWLADAQAAYDEEVNYYTNAGYSISGYESYIKRGVLQNLVRQAILEAKAEELGLKALSEADLEELGANADDILNQYVEAYSQYFATEGASDEETRQATLEYLASAGLTKEVLIDELSSDRWSDALYQYAIDGVAVTDEEVRARYEQLVADGEASYANSDYSYNSDRMNGELIAWNPEGYRSVTHVLVKFDSDQTSQYKALQSSLSTYQKELEALDTEPAEGEERRDRGDIEADIAATSVELDALYAALLPRAEAVIEAFNGGADFGALIDEYGEDPGMDDPQTRADGYAVAANSTTWDQAFTDGAMSIEAVGGISGPVYGANGIHIIYYQSDITPGPVPFEDIAETVSAMALEQKVSDTYNSQVEAWIEEAAPVYHYDRF